MLDADYAPDKWWTSVPDTTPATIALQPQLPPYEGTPDGAYLIFDATTKQFVPGLVGVFDEFGRVNDSALPARLSDAAIQAKIDSSTPNIDLTPYALKSDYQPLSAKGQANGYASLDASGVVPVAQIPSGIGDVTQADLDAATAPLQSSIDGLTAQQDQLMATAATVDELTGSIKTDGIWPTTSAITCLQTSAHSNIVHSLWVAPFPCKLTAFTLVREYGSTVQSDSNYISVELRRKVPNGALNVIATKTTKVTGGEAMTSRVPWNFDGASWDDTAATFAAGDFISVEATVVGSEELRYPVTFSFSVQPL